MGDIPEVKKSSQLGEKLTMNLKHRITVTWKCRSEAKWKPLVEIFRVYYSNQRVIVCLVTLVCRRYIK